MAYQPLKGQKALVTGASSGIGAGVARAAGRPTRSRQWSEASR